MAKQPWWSNGIKFQCQGSGNCCVSHGEYGFVYLTKEDRQNMAQVLGISASSFTKKYCKQTDGLWHINDKGPDCTFLKNKRCTVYKARPMQCRTWPFWPETMNAKAWKKDVVSFCPGVGKGPTWSRDTIAGVMEEQTRWEQQILDNK